MSQSVQDVLNAISEASAALNREPEYKTRITELERSLNSSTNRSETLALDLASHKDQIDSLTAKVRSLEVERDDAGFRELEAQDKLDALRSVVESFTAKTESLKPKVVPITPVPTASVASVAEAPTQQAPIAQPEQAPHPVQQAGQSGPSPFSASTTQASDTTSSASPTATHMELVPTPKPYEGKTYTQVFGSLGSQCGQAEWVDKGGTIDNWSR